MTEVLSNPYMAILAIGWIVGWTFFIGSLLWIIRDRQPAKLKHHLSEVSQETWNEFEHTCVALKDRQRDVFCWVVVILAFVVVIASIVSRLI